jgi:hypothetical protein
MLQEARRAGGPDEERTARALLTLPRPFPLLH